MARRASRILWIISVWSLTLCCASCYEELSKFMCTLPPTTSIVLLLPPESCNHTLFVFLATQDNYSLIAADDTLLAEPEETCLDPDAPINGSRMITHDYGDYVFDAFAYIVNYTFCGNDSSSHHPVICAYENEEPMKDKKRKLVKHRGVLPLMVITILFICISLICSSMLITTYSLFKNLRTLPGQTVLNLAMAFFLSDVMTIVITAVLDSTRQSPSPWLFIIQNTFFNGRFMWMAIVGFEISRHVYKGMTLKFDTPAKKRRWLTAYLAIGWGLPVVVGAASAAVEFSGAEAHRTTKLFAANGRVVIYGPISLSLAFNVAVATFLMVLLRIAHMRRSKFRGTVKKGTLKFSKVFLVVLTVLGFTWFAVFLLLTIAKTVPAVQYIYILLNTTQPIFVCVAFLGNQKTIAQYAALFGCRKDDGMETSSTFLLRRRMTRFISLIISEREFNTYRHSTSQSDSRSGSQRHNSILTYMSSFISKRGSSPPPPAKIHKDITSNGNKDSDSSNNSGGANSKTDLSTSALTYVSGNFSAPILIPPELSTIPELDSESKQDSLVHSNDEVDGHEQEGGLMDGGREEMAVERGGGRSKEGKNRRKISIEHNVSHSSITPLIPEPSLGSTNTNMDTSRES